MKVVHASPGSLEEHCRRLMTRRAELEQDLADEGLLVFRGFPVPDAASFGVFADAIVRERSAYVAGQTDRAERAARVYQATRLPGLLPIPLHAEMAYSKVFPTHLLFHVERRAYVGGDSRFAYNRAIADALPEALRSRLEAQGVRYIRRLPDRRSPLLAVVRATRTGGLKSWQASLGVQDRAEAERVLAERDVPHSWRGDWLDLSMTLPAFRDGCWFNQLHTAHIHQAVHGSAAVALNRLLVRAAGFALLDARFGDDTPFSRADLNAVQVALRRASFRVRLERQDVVLFDNLALSHGRARYLGFRRLNAAFSGLP